MGDMAELGESAMQDHADVGVYAKKKGIDQLFAIGPLSKAACETFGNNASWFEKQEQLIEVCLNMETADTAFLCKGSRSSGMDRIVTTLLEGGRDNVVVAH